jgi:hypothetical protein
LDASAQGEPESFHGVMAYKAATRHINNIVHEAVEEAGGPQIIRQTDDRTWAELEDDILKSIEEELVDLRADIDHIVHGSHSDVWRSRAFHILLEDSEGAGNDHLVECLSRAHGAALSA